MNMKKIIAFLFLTSVVNCGVFANDVKAEAYTKLDSKALSVLIDKLNKGELDLNSDDIVALKNIDTIYREVKKNRPSSTLSTEKQRLRYQ
jgi:hypothetical protein